MKKIFFIVSFYFCATLMFSQYIPPLPIKGINQKKTKELDVANMDVSYTFSFMRDTLKPNEYWKDIQTLQIGKRVSKYYSQNLLDRTFEEDYHQGVTGACSFEVFKLFSKKKLIVTDVANDFFLGSNFRYEEAIPNFYWKITNETSRYLSYTCYKALTRFRGRNYEVWFTKDIKVSDGPWKFCGLPGLILRVQDDRKEILFECTSISDKSFQKIPINMLGLKFKDIDRWGLHLVYEEMLDDAIKYAEKNDLEVRNQIDYIEKQPFNPIEKE